MDLTLFKRVNDNDDGMMIEISSLEINLLLNCIDI